MSTSNSWFKFYGADYLSDPKMLSLDAVERSCWMTLMCHAMITNNVIKYIDSHKLLMQSGVDPIHHSDAFDAHQNIIKTFEELEMIRIDNGVITLKNWENRQETNLTGYERVKRHREKKRDDNAVITTDKIRKDKNRINTIEHFEKFWNLYPRKIGKAVALKKFSNLSDAEMKAIAKALPQHLKSWEGQEKKYIPHPSTWLNQRRWEDEVEITKTTKRETIKL